MESIGEKEHVDDNNGIFFFGKDICNRGPISLLLKLSQYRY